MARKKYLRNAEKDLLALDPCIGKIQDPFAKEAVTKMRQVFLNLLAEE